MNQSKHLVLYHHLTAADWPAARDAIAHGAGVACLMADSEMEDELRDAVHSLGLSSVPIYFAEIETELSADVVETMFQALCADARSLAWLRDLYGSFDVDHYFRRVVLAELGCALTVAHLMSRAPFEQFDSIGLAGDWPVSPVLPALIGLTQDADFGLGDGARLPGPVVQTLRRLTISGDWEHGPRGTAGRVYQALHTVAWPWYWALKRLRARELSLPTRRLMLRTYPSDRGMDAGDQRRLRNIDFVVDGKELPAHDVAVWAEAGVPEERRVSLQKKGYFVLSAGDVKFGPIALVSRVLPALVSYTLRLPRLLRRERSLGYHVSHLVSQYILWREVARVMKPAVFLAYNDLSPTDAARNVVLREHGCACVGYEHANRCAMDGQWHVSVINPTYSVLNAFAVWSPIHVDLFQRHPLILGDSWDVGCLWAEHARLVDQDETLNRYYEQRLASHVSIGPGQRQRVAIFDTAVTPMFAASDLVSFYAGVARLARRLPDVLFLCKPKKPVEELFAAAGEFGDQTWGAISVSANVVFLPSDFETAAVVGLSEVTVSACFSSPTVEAIGCGKPAIYYDPTDRVPGAFWREIPGMVCVADDELHDRVQHLLRNGDNASYREYLTKYCARVEGHFDGLAISRLRRRLIDVMECRRTGGDPTPGRN